MKVDCISIRDFFIQNNQFIIPIYQRNYEWGTSQCKKLIEDVFLSIDNNKTHFLGTTVRKREEDNAMNINYFSIVDGQQRLTTVLIILSVVNDLYMDKCITGNKEFFSQYIKNEVKENMDGSKNENDAYKIINANDNKQILYIADHKYDKLDKESCYYKNLKYVKDCLSREIKERINNQSLNEILKKFVDGLFKFQIVDILLQQEDDAQEIFECINGTGIVLETTDLIKNYILMNMPLQKQKEVYKHWCFIENNLNNKEFAKFFRTYIICRDGKSITTKALNNYFVEHYKNYDKEKLCLDLKEMCDLYLNICGKEHNLDKDINHKLELYSLLSMIDSINFFILKILDDYKKEIISKESLIKILNLMENYIIRKVYHNNREWNHIFEQITEHIVMNYSDNLSESEYVNIICNEFYILKESTVDNRRFRNDNELSNDLFQNNLYNGNVKNDVLKFILIKINEYNNKDKIDELFKYQIEHILPQTLDGKYKNEWVDMLGENYIEKHQNSINLLGNFTLTKYNQEMSNKSFEHKLNDPGGYKENVFVKLNDYILKQTIWNDEKIKDRTNQLIDIIKKIWPFPEDNIKKIKKSNIVDYEVKNDNLIYDFNMLKDYIEENYNSIIEYSETYIQFKYNNKKYICFEPNKKSITMYLILDPSHPEDELLKIYNTKHVEYCNFTIKIVENINLEKIKKYIDESFNYIQKVISNNINS